MTRASALPGPAGRFPLGLFVALLAVDVLVLIFEKMAAQEAGVAVGNEVGFYLKLAQLPSTWLAVALSPLQLVLWSKILTRTDLSVAYPISSLCFPLTMMASVFVFSEQVSWLAWTGGLLIAAGTAIVGGDKQEEATVAPDGSLVPPVAIGVTGDDIR